MDGTILDTKLVTRDLVKEISTQHEVYIKDDFYLKTDGMKIEDIAKVLIADYNLPLIEEEFANYYNDLITNIRFEINLTKGAQELIRHFHANDIPMAAVGSVSEELKDLMTYTNSRIFQLFHHIVWGGSDLDVENGKPAPDIYKVCASRFEDEPKPEQCLVFEDSPNGLTAALAAGMQVVMVADPSISYDVWKQASIRIESLDQTPPELFGLPPIKLMEPPVRNINFDMKFGEEKKPLDVWDKIRAEVRKAMELEKPAEVKSENSAVEEKEGEEAEETGSPTEEKEATPDVQAENVEGEAKEE